MNYACKYIKQFLFETHKHDYNLLKKLELCFSLFHRDTRFLSGDAQGSTGHLTEFQNPKSNFKIELNKFEN